MIVDKTAYEELKINKGTKPEGIIFFIFQSGYIQGIENAKTQRSQEFKTLINNTETSNL